MANRICGYCMTNFHASCKPSITYYDRTWTCDCNCQAEVVGTDNSVSDTAPEEQDQPTKEIT
jgi:hypothetical protein